MRGMPKLVRDNPPNKLREISYGKLRAMGLTEKLGDKVNSFEEALAEQSISGDKELWLTGRIDKQARSELEQSGWTIKEDANRILR